VNFLHFLSSRICISPTVVVSSISPPRCHLSSGRRRHAPVPCHASFPSSQDELDISNSSFGNVSSCRLTSQAETEALNPYHHHRLPSSNRPTSTIHCYKKIISTLITLLTTQSCLQFTSFLTRAPHHRSITHHRCSLSPLSHAHRPST
jgi:hypothetical protein